MYPPLRNASIRVLAGFVFAAILLGIPILGRSARSASSVRSEDGPGERPSVLVSEIERYGITWKFAEAVPTGRFVNGDPYVVGSVTVVSVDPAPTAERNGSVLNPPPDPGRSGFDARSPGGRFDPKLRAAFPCRMNPGDCLISTRSVDRMGEVRAQLRPSDEAQSPVLSASILTCLYESVPQDAFRPSYADRGQKIYLARSLRRSLLPRLPRVEGEAGEGGWTSRADPEEWAKRFERPWLDLCTFGFDAPVEYMPHYGREIGRAVGIASLILCLDFEAAEKERLLLGFVQYGIDLWGIARSGHPGWPAHGGHGSGRKWPIVFAGILLGDLEMQSPSKTCPGVRFGEDMQTQRGKGWAGATALYAGHMGEEGEKHEKGWGPYEHLPPAKWLSPIGEDYRRCCTSNAWVGQALAARILGAEKVWDHEAFFEYVDRWMEEDDGDAVRRIREETGKDYSADWMRQGQAWDPLVTALWKRYRHALPKTEMEADEKAEEKVEKKVEKKAEKKAEKKTEAKTDEKTEAKTEAKTAATSARWRPRTIDWSGNPSPVLGDWGFDRPGYPEGLYIHGVTVPAGERVANPLIYDNDVYDDVFDDELAMVLASRGEMDLVGLIVTPVLTDGWGFSKPEWKKTAEEARRIAEASGLCMDRIPEIVVGTEAESEKAGERKDSAGARFYIRAIHEQEARDPSRPLIIGIGGQGATLASAYSIDPSIAAGCLVYYTDIRVYNGHYAWASTLIAKHFRVVSWGDDHWWITKRGQDEWRVLPRPLRPEGKDNDPESGEWAALTRMRVPLLDHMVRQFQTRGEYCQGPRKGDGYLDGTFLHAWLPGIWDDAALEQVRGSEVLHVTRFSARNEDRVKAFAGKRFLDRASYAKGPKASKPE